MITASVLRLLANHSDYTLEQIQDYVQFDLDVPVSKEYVIRAIKRNRHKITVDIGGLIRLSYEWERK